MSRSPAAGSAGDWLTFRGTDNRAAAGLPGRGGDPGVLARWRTGADVRQIVEFDAGDGNRAALIVAGTTIQAWRWDGTLLWSDTRSAITRVLHTAETVTGPVALVLSGERTVRLIDLLTGSVTWRYETPPESNLSGPGSSKLAIVDGRVLWLTAPTYSTAVTCHELISGTEVTMLWSHEFAGHYDAGFGPVLIVADVLGTGSPQVLMSTRTGSGYGAADDSGVPTERLVLGRDDGRLLQAVLDLSTGETLHETTYRPDDGDYPCARPYGLLATAQADSGRIVVMVSCQVEEYYSATRVTGSGLERAWGKFVEKDWPHDDQELRPQVSSLVPGPDGRPWLLTGHHDGTTWTTVVHDAASGDRLHDLPGHYFWGTLSGPQGTAVIVSPATSRALSGTEPLRSVRLDDLSGTYSEHPGHPVGCAGDILPADVSFHAERRSLLASAAADGDQWLLTAHSSGEAVWWHPWTGASRPAGVAAVKAGYPGLDGVVVVVTGDGTLRRISPEFTGSQPIAPAGRRVQALVVADPSGRPALIVDGEQESQVIRSDGTSQLLPGRLAAAGRASDAAVVACITDEGSGAAVTCWRIGPGEPEQVSRISTRGRPTDVTLLDDARLVMVSERTGVHTSSIGVYELDGTPCWQDTEHGAHPNTPLAAAGPDGRWRVAYDDHGLLNVRDAHTGELLLKDDWTAAYTTPVYLSGADELWLRVGGIHGVDALDGNARHRWRHTAALWEYYPGEASVAGATVLGCMTRDGRLDAFRPQDGERLWSTEIGTVAHRPPLVCVQLSPGAGHSFVTGTTDGRLVAVDAASGMAQIWPLDLGASIETLAVGDTTGDGAAQLLVGTADGVLHLVNL